MTKSEENITTVEIDPHNLPPLTAAQQAELDTLAARPDSEIDYSDIPPLGDLERFYRPVKEMTTVRIDADVLHWLRSQGRGYQTKINAILRKEMLAARRRAESAA
jgi:uncharacterized protein (DUF4415 family)